MIFVILKIILNVKIDGKYWIILPGKLWLKKKIPQIRTKLIFTQNLRIWINLLQEFTKPTWIQTKFYTKFKNTNFPPKGINEPYKSESIGRCTPLLLRKSGKDCTLIAIQNAKKYDLNPFLHHTISDQDVTSIASPLTPDSKRETKHSVIPGCFELVLIWLEMSHKATLVCRDYV